MGIAGLSPSGQQSFNGQNVLGPLDSPLTRLHCFPVHQGESGLGKSTLINTLFNTTLYPRKEVAPPHQERPRTVAIESISAGTYLAGAFGIESVHSIKTDRIHVHICSP